MVKALYYHCYYAYLKGDFEGASLYFNLLRDEFKIQGRKDDLDSGQYQELAHIRTALETGSISTKSWVSQDTIVPDDKERQDIRQDDLVRRIHEQGLSCLRKIFNDNLSLYNLEHPCPPYGRVDMVYKGNDTLYVVEVKKDRGEHDLIGQILKYDLYNKMRLHYGLYDRVVSATICHSYQEQVCEELKSYGIRPLVYTGTDNFVIKEL